MAQPGPFVILGIKDGIVLRYDSSTQTHDFAIPGRNPVRLGTATTANNVFSSQNVSFGSDPAKDSVVLNLLVPGSANRRIALNFAGYGSYCCNAGSGQFAYGVATAASAVPRSGTAQYRGVLFDVYDTPGEATITIDFGSGKVSGLVRPIFNDGIGGLDGPQPVPFEGMLPTTGSNFQITFPIGTTGRTGTIDFQLAGPNAEELIFRWQAVIAVPHLDFNPAGYVLPGVAKRD